MNLKEIKEMINLMNENNLMELEVEKEGMRIRLKKSTSADIAAAPLIVEREFTREKSSPSSSREEVQATQLRLVEIKAPMVGTFYRAPSPESSPYVEIGNIIEPGQVICIIEAMKLMNEIKSEIKGKVTEILVDNAEPVEYGQALFLVEPL